MNAIAPTLTLDVDVANPGQFFACCGLLELADALARRSLTPALGWFDDAQFHLTTDESNLIESFLKVEIHPERDDASPPVQIAEPFDVRLDWWEDETATRAGFKTWSGGQTVMGFLDGLRKHAADVAADIDQALLLTQSRPIRSPKPVYFDSRLSRLTSLDFGFSTERFTAAYSPAAEVLALVGLQRFRPATVVPREQYRYDTWSSPLPVSIAAAAAHGLIPPLNQRTFEFPLVVRTGGKYKAFGPSEPVRSNHDQDVDTIR